MSEMMLFTFDAWRGYLEFDAEQVGIRQKVELMRDTMLESLWRAGVAPTVGAVIKYCEAPGPLLCTECENPVSKGSALCAVHHRLIRDESIRKAKFNASRARAKFACSLGCLLIAIGYRPVTTVKCNLVAHFCHTYKTVPTPYAKGGMLISCA
jgi:hypothetical protein